MKDLYSILGTDVNSSPSDIREAYRKLSKKFHPDLNDNDPYFGNRFREIREAYEVLSNPITRSAYNNQLKKSGTFMPVSAAYNKPAKVSVNSKINWAFTAMLLMFTALFGYYVVREVTHTKITKPPVVAETATRVLPLHNKKRHHKKVDTNIGKSTAKPLADTISARVVKTSISRSLAPAVAVAENPKPAAVAPVALAMAKPVVQAQPKPIAALPTTVVSAKPQNTAHVNPAKPASVIAAVNVTPTISDAYIKANATGIVYMRRSNDYNSDVVNTIPGDTKVTVLEKGSNFYKISYNNKTGYVPNWTVQFR